MTKSLVLKMIAALSMTSLVACSGAGSDLTEEEFLAEQESIALEALAEISADDLVEKSFDPTTPRVGDGTTFSMSSVLGNASACTIGTSGLVEVLTGSQQGPANRCLFQIIGSGLNNARIVYTLGRLRASGSRNGNAVVFGGGNGTSFSKVRIVRDGKKLADGTPTYNIFLQNSNRVIDVPRFRLNNGQRLTVWNRNGGNNQRWIFRED